MDKLIQGELFADIFPAMPTKKLPRNSVTSRTEHLPPYRVVRNTRRKRNVVAYRKGGVIEIHIPSRTTREEESRLIPEMISRVLQQETARAKGVEHLWQMAQEIMSLSLPELTTAPTSIEWKRMNERWGSCTPQDGSIRLSHRLTLAPEYVLRSVIFHELVHLLVPNHGKEFLAYLERNPDQDRSEAFLEGYEYSMAHNEISPSTSLLGPEFLPKMA